LAARLRSAARKEPANERVLHVAAPLFAYACRDRGEGQAVRTAGVDTPKASIPPARNVLPELAPRRHRWAAGAGEWSSAAHLRVLEEADAEFYAELTNRKICPPK
jgi:hypothetical protein